MTDDEWREILRVHGNPRASVGRLLGGMPPKEADLKKNPRATKRSARQLADERESSSDAELQGSHVQLESTSTNMSDQDAEELKEERKEEESNVHASKKPKIDKDNDTSAAAAQAGETRTKATCSVVAFSIAHHSSCVV